MSITEKAEDGVARLGVVALVVILIVMLLVYIASFAALAAVVVGLVWGIAKYLMCLHAHRTIIGNIKHRHGPGAFGELCRAHYSVVEDADLQMDIWLNKGIGNYVAPGDDAPPSSSYGFVRFASWPFVIRWIPCIAYLMFTAFLRVGFLVCFAFAAAKFGLCWIGTKFSGRSGGTKEEAYP